MNRIGYKFITSDRPWISCVVATTIRILPPKSAVARSRNLPTSWTHFTMLVYYDSLSLSISFSSQLKTCHQARQTYEINPLESCESVSVRTSYFKAIVSSDSRHALARLTITRRLDTRYTNTTIDWIRYTYGTVVVMTLRRSYLVCL